MTTEQSVKTNDKLRWLRPTPGRLLVILLVAEAVLLLSERFQWFAFNEKKGWTVLIAVAAVGVFLLLMLLWYVTSLIFHWRFQFSIRSLLVLTVAVALPCSWLGVEMKWAREQKEAVEALRSRFRGEIEYQFTNVGYHIYSDYAPFVSYRISTNSTPPGPAWLRKIFGDDFFTDVTALFLNGDVTDVDLELLKGMNQLQHLKLNRSQITDTGLECLKDFSQLQTLWLDHTKITDAGLEHFKGMRQLRWVKLNNTQVTESGVEKLAKALPNCDIRLGSYRFGSQDDRDNRF